ENSIRSVSQDDAENTSLQELSFFSINIILGQGGLITSDPENIIVPLTPKMGSSEQNYRRYWNPIVQTNRTSFWTSTAVN
ncbi:hypothetical protein TNCV_1594531, partial [Trichonephila clavipes]